MDADDGRPAMCSVRVLTHYSTSAPSVRPMDATIELPNSLSLSLSLSPGYPIDDARSSLGACLLRRSRRIINGLCHVRISLLILNARPFRFTVASANKVKISYYKPTATGSIIKSVI